MSGFVLYNAPQSTCSQRVRFMLNAKGLAFEEHSLDLFAGDYPGSLLTEKYPHLRAQLKAAC